MAFTIRAFRCVLPLVSCSSACALLTLLLLNAEPASAEWVAIADKYQLPGLRTVYLDPDTIVRDGNLVTLWQLSDFKSSQGDRGGFRHILSTKTQKQFDCVSKRARLLAYVEFSRHMGAGLQNVGLVDTGTWLPCEPDNLDYALWELVCGKS